MEEVRADTSLWADMDTIRRAHLAETNALENVVTALASKYFSSISALQRQVEAITEWQSEVEERFHSGESRRHNGVVDGEEKTEECSNDALDAGDCQAPSDSKHIQVGKARIRCSGQETLNGQHEKVFLPPAEDLTFLVHRVEALEMNMLEVQKMWDVNEARRILKLWMGLFNRTAYKSFNCDDPVDCAIITIQIWWRNMLMKKLGWRNSSHEWGVSGVYEKMIQEDYEATSSRPREAHPSSSLEAPVDPMEHRIKPMEQSNLLGSTAVNPASVLSEVAQPHGSGTTCAGRVTSQPKFPNKYGKGNTTTTSEEDTPEDHQPPAADCVPVSSPFCPQEMYSGVEATLKGSNGRAAKQVPADPRFGGDKKLPKEYNEKPGIIGKSPLMKIKKGGAPSDGSVNLKSALLSHSLRCWREASGENPCSLSPPLERGRSILRLFDGAMGKSPVLLIASLAMQLWSLETEIDIVRKKQEDHQPPDTQHQKSPPDDGAKNTLSEQYRSDSWCLGKLQREVQSLQDREEDREKRTELALEAMEIMMTTKDEEAEQRLQQKTEENAQKISLLLDQVGRQVPQDKCDLVSRLLLELKLELRSLYFSLVAISDNEASATLLRTMEGIRHLLTSLAENAKGLEEEIGDPVMLAKCIVADDTAAQHFVGKATDLGITLFAFIKAQALQARRARDGTFAANLSHRRSSDADAASAVIAANLSGIEDSDGKGAIEDSNDEDRAGTSASPQAWAKLSSLTYIRARTNEKLSFPAGLVVLLKSISGVLNHAIGTGELAIRLGVTLEDLTLYVAQRADKERELVVRDLGAPLNNVKTKLREIEGSLAGFQHTIDVLVGEIESDKERSDAIEDLGVKVGELQTLFSRVSCELDSKACASEIEKALHDMASKIHESADQQGRLQRLGKTLAKDSKTLAAIKRLQIDLEQSRAQSVAATLGRDNEVLIRSRCLSCNRPVRGFPTSPMKPTGEWFTGAGDLGGAKDRIVEPTAAGTRGDDVGSAGSSRPPGQTQPKITTAKLLPPRPGGERVGPAPQLGASQKKGPQGPLLFEMTGEIDGPAFGLKGRVLRGGGATPAADGKVHVSKYPRLVPITAPKTGPRTEARRVASAAMSSRNRSAMTTVLSEWMGPVPEDASDRGGV